MNTRARVTAVPALIAAGALASLPGFLKVVAADQASPEAAAVPAGWADLGLPELELHFTSAEVTGMPASIEAGRYLVTIHGEPTEEDFAFGPMFLQLPEGMTLDDLAAVAAEAASLETPPDFYYQSLVAGGPTIVHGTGATSAAGIVDLPAGDWVVAGSAMAQPPAPFTVTGELPAVLPEPESTATFTIGEMVINLSAGELIVGENLVKVENIGAQPHFIDISKVPDGTTAETIEATLAGFMGATPEVEPLAEEDFHQTAAYSNEQSGQTVQWSVMTFPEPGTYAALCFIPDPESGMPHAFMGMYAALEVVG